MHVEKYLLGFVSNFEIRISDLSFFKKDPMIDKVHLFDIEL